MRDPSRSRRMSGTRAAVAILLLVALPATSTSPTTAQVPHRDGVLDATVLRHDTRDELYRRPGGAVPTGQPVILRLRTRHGDAASARVRLHASGVTWTVPMHVAASGVSCYGTDGSCDWWEADVVHGSPATMYYRFEVVDLPSTTTYRDDVLWDGGAGSTIRLTEADLTECCFRDFAITVHAPDLRPVPWLRDGAVYQIFPDRFRNGDPSNDPTGTEPRYRYPGNETDRITPKAWDDLPEGNCRGYVSGCTSAVQNRDYFGGDLHGITEGLDHLAGLGITVLYLNPIFEAASNHRYDTRDWLAIDGFLGTHDDWLTLVREADARGIRIVLDGVFVSASSDSPSFDRYGHFETAGACETESSVYRSWFVFTAQPLGPCAGPLGAGYESWYGYDSLPLLDKDDPGVRDLVRHVGRRWLTDGAAGWRVDSMTHPSFPVDFWHDFRAALKETANDAAVVAEVWQRQFTLPMVHGDTADAVMNYGFRAALLGLFGGVDEGFDPRGAGRPSYFASNLAVLLEDMPDAIAESSWNVFGTHDTARILWRLTPGPNDPAQKADNAAAGIARLRLAALIQAGVPGVPHVYYGDEIGVTGDDDPDNRRTYPTGGGDTSLSAWFRTMLSLREDHPVLRTGDLRFQLVNDAARTIAWSRTDGDALAIVAVNADEAVPRTVRVPVDVRDGVRFVDALTGVEAVSTDGAVDLTLPPLTGAVLVPVPGQDLHPPPAPVAALADDGTLSWSAVPDAVAYRIYGGPLEGAGYELVTTTADLRTHVPTNAHHYVVRAVDEHGNASRDE